jgi:hypothetical protein
MTKLRRRPSRADIKTADTKAVDGKPTDGKPTDGKPVDMKSMPTTKLPAAKVEGRKLAAPPARPTLSVATVGVTDVPSMLSEPPHADDDVGLLKLISAIDGKTSVKDLAQRCHLELEQVRALIATLQNKGFVSLRQASKPASDGPKGGEYWLAGLKPRTR